MVHLANTIPRLRRSTIGMLALALFLLASPLLCQAGSPKTTTAGTTHYPAITIYVGSG